MRENWATEKLGEFAFHEKGKKPKSQKTTKDKKHIYPYINIEAFEKGIISNYTDGEKCKFCSEEDFLMVWDGSRSGLVGKGIDGVLGSTLMRINFPKIENDYAFYFLSSKYQEINTRTKGTGTPHVDPLILWNYDFPIAPLPEQRAIVTKIEELFSDLDKGIADLKKAQAQLAVYRQAVLKKAFEGELTKEWRNNQYDLTSAFEYLTEVKENRKKEYEQRKKAGEKKLRKNFEFSYSQSESIISWAKGTLDQLIYIAARIGWRGLKKNEYTDEGPYFLSVHSLNYGKYVDFSETFHISNDRYIESPEIQLREYDVLLCKDGAGIGKIGIIKDLPGKASVNSSLLVIRGLEVFDQEFLYYLFSGPGLQSIVSKRITGSATPHLFQNDIRKFELLIPPLKEQYQIVREIESRLSVCDKVEESITKSLEKAQALRQSILKKAFEGTLLSEAKIEQCKKEPEWEPADKLLERIKREKKLSQIKK